MKTIVMSVIFSLLSGVLSAQDLEIHARANSGMFHFLGVSTSVTEWLNYDLDDEDGYVNNPYGKQKAISYGFSGSIQWVTNNRLKFGFDLGYEVLRSKVEVDQVSVSTGTNFQQFDAEGQAYLNNSFINLLPYVGFREDFGVVVLDVDLGIDIGLMLSSEERVSATTEFRTYTTTRERTTVDEDIRPRLQATLMRGKFGVYAGYSNGLTNYRRDFVGGRNGAFGKVTRFGVVYRLM